MGSAVRVTSAAEGLPRRRFTVAEVEAMVAAGVMEEDERVELIGGELVPMSPKGNHHEIVKTALLRRWYPSGPCRNRAHARDDFPPQRGHLSRAGRRDLSARERAPRADAKRMCCSSSRSPNSSLRYDTGRKAALYASFGIRELWVIDAVRLTTRMFRDPAADGYRSARDFGPADRLTPQIAPRPSRSGWMSWQLA